MIMGKRGGRQSHLERETHGALKLAAEWEGSTTETDEVREGMKETGQ